MNVVAAANPSAREQGLPSPVPPGHFGSTRVGRAHLRLDMGEDTGFWGMLLNPDPHLSHPRVPGAGFWRWASRSSTFHGCAALLPSAGPGSAHPVSKGNSPSLAQAAPPSQHPKKMCCCNSPPSQHPQNPRCCSSPIPHPKTTPRAAGHWSSSRIQLCQRAPAAFPGTFGAIFFMALHRWRSVGDGLMDDGCEPAQEWLWMWRCFLTVSMLAGRDSGMQELVLGKTFPWKNSILAVISTAGSSQCCLGNFSMHRWTRRFPFPSSLSLWVNPGA